MAWTSFEFPNIKKVKRTIFTSAVFFNQSYSLLVREWELMFYFYLLPKVLHLYFNKENTEPNII